MSETEAIGESRSPVTHVLKTLPGPFYDVRVGAKPYEIRRDDRNFRVGDTLHLCEWCPEDEAFSGAEIEAWVTYKTEGGEWGLPEGLCVLGIDVRMIWIHSGPEFHRQALESAARELDSAADELETEGLDGSAAGYRISTAAARRALAEGDDDGR